MRSFAAAAVLLAISDGAKAQDPPRPPLSRGDIHVAIGWQNLEGPGSRLGGRWINTIFWGGAGAGWYWTEHLKTQIDFGSGTAGSQRRSVLLTLEGHGTSQSSTFLIRERSVAVTQQYQFYRNRWVHPYVGGGAAIAQTTTSERFEPVLFFDTVTRVTRTLAPARIDGPHDSTTVRPFGNLGFKAYLARRAFFATDVRVMVRQGVDEVLFRFGAGVDF
jgi:hypothetical protein